MPRWARARRRAGSRRRASKADHAKAPKVTPDAKLTGKAAEKARRKRKKAAKARADEAVQPGTWAQALRVDPGFSLADLDPHSTPGFTGDKKDGREVMGELQSTAR